MLILWKDRISTVAHQLNTFCHWWERRVSGKGLAFVYPLLTLKWLAKRTSQTAFETVVSEWGNIYVILLYYVISCIMLYLEPRSERNTTQELFSPILFPRFLPLHIFSLAKWMRKKDGEEEVLNLEWKDVSSESIMWTPSQKVSWNSKQFGVKAVVILSRMLPAEDRGRLKRGCGSRWAFGWF